MKFVVIVDPRKAGKDRITDFIYPDPGPIPPIVNPPKPDEPKDMPPEKEEEEERIH